MSAVLDRLLDDCVAAGIIFHPKAGQLRPELTKGRPPESLLERVKANREQLIIYLAELMNWNWEEEEPTYPPRVGSSGEESESRPLPAQWSKETD